VGRTAPNRIRDQTTIATTGLRKGLRNGQEGSFALRVVLIVGTLVVVGGLVLWLVVLYPRALAADRRRAQQISEDGLIQALNTLQRQPSWREGIPRTSHGEGWYEVSVTRGDSPQHLVVVSEGQSGKVVREQTCELGLVVDSGGSTWVQTDLRLE
jgi:hypothetical protein